MEKGSIQFQLDERKALEAMLYILSKQPAVNIYNLVKAMFEADKTHLNQHGRPVTGDVYFKMEHGTVPSAIYDMIKGNLFKLADLELEKYPFTIEGHDIKASRAPDMGYLSKSDIAALDEGIKKYLHLPFGKVKEINHQEKCWLDGTMNAPISFESMIENPKILDQLKKNGLKRVV